ncbi:hypothetical protein CYMTET_26659, partial [Cymbomonas tetramitiformis]
TVLDACYDDHAAAACDAGECTVHADCPFGYFCALTGDAASAQSVCAPCQMCAGCFSEFDAGIINGWLWSTTLLRPAEPTCGHCMCNTDYIDPAQPQCNFSVTYNNECDIECWDTTGNWDNRLCYAEDFDDPHACGEKSMVPLGSTSDEYRMALCCEPAPMNATMEFDVFLYSTPDTAEGVIPSSDWDGTNTVLQRRINDGNKVMIGLLLHVTQYGVANCSSDRWYKLEDTCRAGDVDGVDPSELESYGQWSYGVDTLFQEGSNLYEEYNGEELVANQDKYYPDPEDVNEFGVPYGFKAFHMEGLEPGYPVLLDINVQASRAKKLLEFYQDSNFIDPSFKQLRAEMITYNPEAGLFGKYIVTFNNNQGGDITVLNDLQVFTMEYLEGPVNIFRLVLEGLFVLMFLKSLCGWSLSRLFS